jgi:hypothetical protein
MYQSMVTLHQNSPDKTIEVTAGAGFTIGITVSIAFSLV